MGKKTRVFPYPDLTLTERYDKRTDLIEGSTSESVTHHQAGPTLSYYLSGSQFTDSETHPHWKNRKRGVFRGDIGGPFSSRSKRLSFQGPAWTSIQNRWAENPTYQFPGGSLLREHRYTGPYLPLGPDAMYWPNPQPSSDSFLDVLGAQAIARCSPSNPTVDLSVTVGELVKEGIPRLIGSTIGSLKSMSGRQRRKELASNYLNYEFGWKPLINEILDFSQAIVNADEIIRSYERDSGRVVRRGYEFPEQKTSQITEVARWVSPWVYASSSAIIDWFTVNQGRVYLSEKTSTRRWFRGAFSYYVPPPNGLRNSIARDVIFARKVLGLSLTPDVVWNLSPWSWMFDWFFNAGDVISSWTDWAIDNQVLLWGYLMEHKVHEASYTFVGPTGYVAAPPPPTVNLVSESKVRRKATPYGFGLSWDGFSVRQLAILSALGITKS